MAQTVEATTKLENALSGAIVAEDWFIGSADRPREKITSNYDYTFATVSGLISEMPTEATKKSLGEFN